MSWHKFKKIFFNVQTSVYKLQIVYLSLVNSYVCLRELSDISY